MLQPFQQQGVAHRDALTEVTSPKYRSIGAKAGPLWAPPLRLIPTIDTLEGSRFTCTNRRLFFYLQQSV